MKNHHHMSRFVSLAYLDSFMRAKEICKDYVHQPFKQNSPSFHDHLCVSRSQRKEKFLPWGKCRNFYFHLLSSHLKPFTKMSHLLLNAWRSSSKKVDWDAFSVNKRKNCLLSGMWIDWTWWIVVRIVWINDVDGIFGSGSLLLGHLVTLHRQVAHYTLGYLIGYATNRSRVCKQL